MKKTNIFNSSTIEIKEKIKEISKKKEELEKEYLEYSRILEYKKLLKEGFSKKEVEKFVDEDDKAIKKAHAFIKKHNKLRDYMFGYPVNLSKDSSMVEYFRMLETKMTLANNCADTYQRSNYQMDSKDYERKILEKLYIHFNLEPAIKDEKGLYKGAWGYITSGGSESNRWGIENGLRKLRCARVYFSSGAHYSVEKAVKLGFCIKGKTYEIPYSIIPTEKTSEKIDTKILVNEIKENYRKDKTPAVIVLTYGTTKTGAIDDVELIINELKDIPHYIHLDCALYGGIAKNQKNAPKVPDLKKLKIDSIAVSLHKYFGNHDVKSAVIARERPYAQNIDYIGLQDSTTAGSRAINPFSGLQRVIEAFEREKDTNYEKNIIKFEKLLKSNKIKYSREENSNIFVIDKPKDEICKKYQLSSFKEKNKQKAHVIIFPFHKEKIMRELVKDLLI